MPCLAHRLQDAALVAEDRVDRADGDASLGGDHLDGRRVVALLKKERARRIHDQRLGRQRLFLPVGEFGVDMFHALSISYLC